MKWNLFVQSGQSAKKNPGKALVYKHKLHFFFKVHILDDIFKFLFIKTIGNKVQTFIISSFTY